MILIEYALSNFDSQVSDNSDSKGITDENMRTYEKK